MSLHDLDLSLFLLLTSLSWALQGAFDAPVMDADETFNYLDPLHYALHGSGFQTWEYAPQYGLRSWFYVEIYASIVRLVRILLENQFFFAVRLNDNKLVELAIARVATHAVSVMCEYALIEAATDLFFPPPPPPSTTVDTGATSTDDNATSTTAKGPTSFTPRRNDNAAWFKRLCVLFMGLSPGMSHARRAVLPSSTCMIAFTLSCARWMRGDFWGALLAGSFAVLVVWPFCALLFVPAGLEALHRRGFFEVVKIGLVSLLAFALIPAAVDSHFYGFPIFPTLKMIAYNALGTSGGGAHLYGVEDWKYYPKNLFLNFNLVSLLGILAMPTFAVLAVVIKATTTTTIATAVSTRFLKYVASPLFLTLILFQSMPHKEERFLSPIYPLLPLGSALFLTLAPLPSRSLRLPLLGLSALLFISLAVARDFALARLVAPSKAFAALSLLDKRLSSSTSTLTVCVGREWHHFPSSFYLPGNNRTRLAFVRSDFSGLLPSPFAPQPHGYSAIPPNMNDLNRHEDSKYLSNAARECLVYVDHDEPYSPKDEIRPGDRGGEEWSELKCFDYCDTPRSPQPFRSFANPFDSWHGVVRRRYCVYVRETGFK